MMTRVIMLCLLMASPVAAQSTFRGCGMTGSATNECGQALNTLKNRDSAPLTVDPSVTLDAMLASGDDLERWDAAQGAEITGYVHDVRPGGLESVNCKRKDLIDIHIELIADPAKDEPSKRVIVEMTPRWQAKMGWTLAGIRKLRHQRVTVRGWLMLDTTHVRSARNTRRRAKQSCGHLPAGDVWRATAWEVHPVTSFDVVTHSATEPCPWRHEQVCAWARQQLERR